MRRLLLLVSVALVIAAMMVATAGAAMASMGAEASGGAACNQGTLNAHSSVPMAPQNETAHENIPCG